MSVSWYRFRREIVSRVLLKEMGYHCSLRRCNDRARNGKVEVSTMTSFKAGAPRGVLDDHRYLYTRLKDIWRRRLQCTLRIQDLIGMEYIYRLVYKWLEWPLFAPKTPGS